MSAEHISFRVTPQEKKEILKQCALENLTLSEFIRKQLKIAKKSEELRFITINRLNRISTISRRYNELNNIRTIMSLISDLNYTIKNYF